MIGWSFRTRALVAITACGLVVAAATVDAAAARPARFHATLKKASPGANDTVAVAPDSLRFWFSEKVELPLTKVTLTAGGKAQKLGEPTFGGTTADAPLVLAVREAVAPGTYTVEWTVAGKDGHPSKGKYDFVVKPAR